MNAKQKDEDRVLFTGQREAKVVDYWIAAIGDSFASGEGNPDRPIDPISKSPALWLSSNFSRTLFIYKILIFTCKLKKPILYLKV